MRRVRASAGLVVATVLLLAGCAAIPLTGSVQTGQTTVPDDPNFVFRPNGPADNANQLDIVRGFVQAASASPDYTVARQFLTADFANQWRPNAGVLIHDDPWTPRQTADDQVRITVPVSATVAADGAYDAGGSRTPLDFDLVQVKGQWRIAKAPDGIVLTSGVFQRVFETEVLRFFDQAGARLVPDLRWFPKRDSQDTAILRALLAGPSAPLTGVVGEAFPSGTELVGPVSELGSITTVSLTVPGAQPDTAVTNRLQQQIAGSLRLAAGTSALRLVVNGRTAPRAPQLAVTVIDGLRPVVLTDGRFGALSAGGVTEDAVFGKRLVALAPTAATVSARQRIAVALSTRGVSVLAAQGAPRVVDARDGLVAPALDQQGWVYSIPADGTGSLMAYRASGGSGIAVSNTSDGADVASIEVSPDGSRMLVVTRSAGTAQAYVAGIVRAADGTPVALASARYTIAVGSGLLAAATWIDDESVALLSQPDGQQTQTVTSQLVGGLPQRLGRLANGAAIVGGTGQDDLRVLLESGDLVQQDSGLWQPEFAEQPEVRVLAVPR